MGITFDRIKASIVSLVRSATARHAYAAPRFARVVAAAPDGSTLDVVPDDPAFPSMGGVPLYLGLPATSIVLAKGTKVLVEFSEADPAKPFVRSWAGGETATTISIAGGEPAAARVGDAVATTITPADFAALATQLLTTGAFIPSGSNPNPSTLPYELEEGEITSGSTIVNLGG